MITLHIITREESQINRIAEWLLKENLVHGGVDVDYQDTLVLENDQLVRKTTFKLQARTKSLLYNIIEGGLKSNFHDNPPYLYTTPIVNMDKDLAAALLEKTLKI
jgi:hypothetical protein